MECAAEPEEESGRDSDKVEVGEDSPTKCEKSDKLRRTKTRTSHSNDHDTGTSRRTVEKRISKTDLSQRYFWDINKHGPHVIVLDDQQDTIRRSVARQHTDGARGSIGYNKGRHTFKFTFNDKPWGSHCAIGVCSTHSKLSVKGYQHIFGTDALSWAWDLPSGCVLHAGETKQIFTDRMNIKVIYMTLDMNRGTLYFQPKGMERFQAFSGLKDGGKELLYPATSLVYGLAEVRISLKHSSYPIDKSQKLSKRRSKSFEKNARELTEKEEKHRKESKNLKTRKNTQEKETTYIEETANETIEKRVSRVSFQVSDNEDDNNSESVERNVDFEKPKARDTGRVRPTEPILTGHDNNMNEDYHQNLAPVDDPSFTCSSANSKSKSEDKSELLSSENQDQPSNEQTETTVEHSHSSSHEDISSQLHGLEESRDAVISQSDLPRDSEEEDEGAQSESNSDSRISQPVHNDENMYLNMQATQDHELFVVQADSVQREFVTERQRTDISLKRPTVLDRESTLEVFSKGIPEPAIYLSRRETSLNEEKSEKTPLYENPFSAQKRSTGERPEAITRYWSSTSVQSTAYEYEQPLEDLDEPEDAQYINIEYLNEDEQYDMQIAHGWDFIQKGGGIQLYPNIPYICIPIPRFQGKVQSVRSKRGFSWGIHKWLIRELPFYSPSLRDLQAEEDTASGIHIGVVSEEYRWFNQGFQIHCSGRYTWSWNSATGEILQAGMRSQSKPTEHESKTMEGMEVDLQAGVIVTLNLYKHKVTLTSGTKVIAEINCIRGKEIFPYVLFNQKGYYPVEIKYLEGPHEYVDKVLNDLKTKDGKYAEHSKNFQGLTRQITTSGSMVTVETGIASASYNWGVTTNGLKNSWGHTVSLSKKTAQPDHHYLATAQSALYGGRHKVEFETQHIGNIIFGLVSESFDQECVAQIGAIHNSTDSKCVTTLGTNSHSWGWDPKTSSLFHGGMFVGKYPRKELEIELTSYARVSMLVDFGHNGYNIVSFRAISEDNRPLDLGIAFVSLPDIVWPAVAIVAGDDEHNIKLRMDYVAGPKDFVTDMRSSACAIL